MISKMEILEKKLDILSKENASLKNRLETQELKTAQMEEKAEDMQIENELLMEKLESTWSRSRMQEESSKLQLKSQNCISEIKRLTKDLDLLKKEIDVKSSKLAERLAEITDLEKERLRKELRPSGGAGFYYKNDRSIKFGGTRETMEEPDLRKILKLLSLGARNINLKLWCYHNFEIQEGSWEMKFKGAWKGGDFFLWICNKGISFNMKMIIYL